PILRRCDRRYIPTRYTIEYDANATAIHGTNSAAAVYCEPKIAFTRIVGAMKYSPTTAAAPVATTPRSANSALRESCPESCRWLNTGNANVVSAAVAKNTVLPE